MAFLVGAVPAKEEKERESLEKEREAFSFFSIFFPSPESSESERADLFPLFLFLLFFHSCYFSLSLPDEKEKLWRRRRRPEFIFPNVSLRSNSSFPPIFFSGPSFFPLFPDSPLPPSLLLLLNL